MREDPSPYSELRRDLVSGEWVLIAPTRARRKEDSQSALHRTVSPKEHCPFENPQATGHGDPLLTFRSPRHPDTWFLQIIPNKYPGVTKGDICPVKEQHGPFSRMEGIGFHELLILHDHAMPIGDLISEEMDILLRALQDRYRVIAENPCADYISIFHNWGPEGGASLDHPHLQILSLPIVPPDIEDSLLGSKRYYKKYGSCVHCEIINWEQREQERIIFENEQAIVIAPYVSRTSYEVRIFPKVHQSYFEDATSRARLAIAEALRFTLAQIKKKLDDPDLNFFIHTAPVHNKELWQYYHWHIEVLPRMSHLAGLELGTGIDIVVVDPKDAAALLRL
ncbi:MAG: DUF4921 family protein [Patescibacteria group bacterium]|nr:DUF4921 family protein [Patescibacteria group bacterium]MDE2437834.1 DUF4921 family protein [Patescibacteria group bacterium]